MKVKTTIIIFIIIVIVLGSILYFYYPDILGYYLLQRARQSYEPIVKTGTFFNNAIDLNPFHRVNPFASIYLNPFDQQRYIIDYDYPIFQLNNCSDQLECAVFCWQNENIYSCSEFAKSKGLINEEQFQKGSNLAGMFEKKQSPGSCQSIAECYRFCNQMLNINTCVDSYRLHGLLDLAQLQDAERVSNAIIMGTDLPGACEDESSCGETCAAVQNMEDCLFFAETTGLLSQFDIQESITMIEAYKQNATPGRCNSKTSCQNFCYQEENAAACINFLQANDKLSGRNADLARKYKAEGAAGCKNKETCDIYCYNPINLDNCLQYAIKVGRINEEELDTINKILDQERKKPFDFLFQSILNK